MRTELKRVEGERARFSGTFSRIGVKTSFGHTKQTVLLTKICDASGRLVADHLWFNLTKGIQALGLRVGDVVEFEARVKSYEKGYRGRREDVYDSPVSTDYKLSYPTKLRKRQSTKQQGVDEKSSV